MKIDVNVLNENIFQRNLSDVFGCTLCSKTLRTEQPILKSITFAVHF